MTFALEKDYAKAIEYQQQVMELCDKLPEPHKNIGLYTLNMGRFCYLGNDMEGAVRYWEDALGKVEKYGEMYENLLEWLGGIYVDRKDYDNQKRILALTEEHNRHELTKLCDEPGCMLERAQYYAYTGDNTQAKECYLKVLAMPMDNKTKEKVHDAYAKYLFGVKDYVSAAEYELSAANAHKETDGKDEAYANLTYTAAQYSFIGKQYQQAVDSYQEVVDYYMPHSSSAALKNLALCWKGMGNAYNAQKVYDKAKECYRKVVAYYEANDKENEEYPKAILRMAKAEKFNKEYEASIEHHQQVMTMFEDRNMAEEYSDAAASLQLCYIYAGKSVDVDLKDDVVEAARNEKLDGMIKEEVGGLEMTRKYLDALTYARSLGTIAGCYYMKGEYANAVDYYRQYMEAIREAVRDEFRMQGEAERMATWQNEISNIRELQELLVTQPVGNEALMGDLAALVYDAELLSKGILLNSSIEFGKVLQAKGDKVLQKVYDQSRTNEEEINRLRKEASTDADLEKILSLTQQNQALQLQLYKECAEYADFTDYISYNWKDVQKAMKETDIAIEFAAIKTGALDNENFMAALVLAPDMASPVALPVCNLAVAKAMETYEILFEDGNNLVWGVLEQFLAGKRRIFFSADGSFNRIGIEYLLYNGMPLSEQFEVYRLSSTKELCYDHVAMKPTKAALFGDIDYTAGATMSKTTRRSLSAMRGTEGAAFGDLRNTLREVDEIQAMLQRMKVKDISRLIGTEASAEAFKSLDGSKVSLLHMATHGVYQDEKKTSDMESMDRSLLAFAGANLDDQGIVTAAEVAQMNLRQCDLAVLSACETGLGKLGEDGVFGLQRGFKNAGVHTLLMSLKNVYDDFTADLMICFYKNLMEGKTKREALVEAQKEIRSRGYDDAQYWATFILLDAY